MTDKQKIRFLVTALRAIHALASNETRPASYMRAMVTSTALEALNACDEPLVVTVWYRRRP